MAFNVYKDFREEVCERMVNESIARQKAGGTANKPPTFTDTSKPTLRPQPLPPMRIKGTDEWPKRIRIALPE